MTSRGPQSVLFVCEHNAGRSQIAAAFFNLIADPGRAYATSAGLNAAPRVHPEIVTVMKEVGIDLSGVVPIELTARMQTEVSFLVTMGCTERCPLIPRGRRADWDLPELVGQPLDRIRATRDQIADLVENLVRGRQWARQ